MTTSKNGSIQKAVWRERPRYYPRQLVTADDLTLEQDYFRDRLRRHNRMLHGYGVVCGAVVRAAAEPWTVIVSRGYLLGPYGDEIYIDRERCVDVRKRCVNGAGSDADPCGPSSDPWCTDPVEIPEDDKPLLIAARYLESRQRPVKVSPAGCGCDTSSCEYSRWRDDYEICVLDECPVSHQRPPDFENIGKGAPPECPDCPTDPWVVLAEATPDKDGRITVSVCACRRQVLSFGGYWWQCQHGD